MVKKNEIRLANLKPISKNFNMPRALYGLPKLIASLKIIGLSWSLV